MHEMDITKSKQKRKLTSPKEETELDYSTMGDLITILKNKETKKNKQKF